MKPTRDDQCDCQSHRGPSRRSFLKGVLGATALGGLAAQGLNTQLAFAGDGYDGDVIVVLSLKGGFDGLNAIVPSFEPRYLNLRPNTGIKQGALLPLDGSFGLHPGLKALKPFWDAGTFGVVHAVGTPNPSRSHFKAMAELERAAPGTSIRSGWLDRTLGLRSAGSAYRGVQMGETVPTAALMGQAPELALLNVDDFRLSGVSSASDRKRWRKALGGMNANAPSAMRAPSRTALSALSTANSLQKAGYRPKAAASYPNTELGKALRDVARLIKSNAGLQAACVDYGDWDMHAGMGTVNAGWLRDHLSELGKCLAAFATDLGSALNRVTLVTLTEFGRRVKENGSGGTDHGHGQAVLLLGGGVDGGKVHGRWPGLAEADLVDGDLAGTTDYRSVLAEVLEKRCRAGSLTEVFPGLPSERVGAFKVRP